MKTILVPTDFSPSANNAAAYAFEMAKVTKADIKLCHALKVPAESIYAAQVAWPLEDISHLTEGAEAEMKFLTLHIEQNSPSQHSGFKPGVDHSIGVGDTVDYIRNVVSDDHISLVVMGMSGANLFSRFLLGSVSRELISKADFPLLLIPKNYVYKPIKKIAFATDLHHEDINTINALAGLASYFNAELLISHVEGTHDAEKKQVKEFLTEVTTRTQYNKIYFRAVKMDKVTDGLEWLSAHGQIDMLVMTHRKDAFLTQSHCEKLVSETHVPLMVLPNKNMCLII
ncbi:hypothetical protein CKK33_15245 [Mucilaginibacter sp. MD40]|uniref:universal stress protein n=1 Tax=Mucilaginibacter sp. MD40 TaxID=2029590 RepID=UPI000BAC99C0|nr:universal stress protein [Mucilaginibacter sp. MD40]PAW94776.1 hypothetical protein CKK33_15245 [Mucilaginibacter sp. MD40]